MHAHVHNNILSLRPYALVIWILIVVLAVPCYFNSITSTFYFWPYILDCILETIGFLSMISAAVHVAWVRKHDALIVFFYFNSFSLSVDL